MRKRCRLMFVVLGLAVGGLVFAISFRIGLFLDEADDKPLDLALATDATDSRPLPPEAVARLGFVRGDTLAGRKHVVAYGYSSDSKLLATADWTGRANSKGFQLWDAESGALLANVPVPIKHLVGVTLSPDGKRFSWGGNDGVPYVGVSDLSNGNWGWRKKGAGPGVFTPDAKLIVIGGDYGESATVVDAATGEVVHTLAQEGRISKQFALSRDGTTVATMSEYVTTSNHLKDFKLELWNLATGHCRNEMAISSWMAERLAISDDGKLVAYTEGKQLILANTVTGAKQWRIENTGNIHAWEFVSFAPGSDYLFGMRTNYDDVDRTTMEMIDAKTGRTFRTLQGESHMFSTADFSPDGRRIATSGVSVPICIWDTASGQILPAYDGHRGPLRFLAISGDGRTIVSSDGDYNVCVWDGTTWKLRRRYDLMSVLSLGLSDDGRSMIVTHNSSDSQLFDLAADTRRTMLRYQSGYSAISRDGTLVAALYRSKGTIEVINTSSGKVIQSLKGHQGDLYALAFSSDGHRLLSATKTYPEVGFDDIPPPPPDNSVRVWDLGTGKELRRWELLAECVALSGDGRTMFAGCADGRISRMEVNTGKELEPLILEPGTVHAIAASANGALLAAANAEGIVLWDLPSGKIRQRLKPDHGITAALAFSSDGRRLASAGADTTILVWDATARE
jgi:WD40 repeat protein